MKTRNRNKDNDALPALRGKVTMEEVEAASDGGALDAPNLDRIFDQQDPDEDEWEDPPFNFSEMLNGIAKKYKDVKVIEPFETRSIIREEVAKLPSRVLENIVSESNKEIHLRTAQGAGEKLFDEVRNDKLDRAVKRLDEAQEKVNFILGFIYGALRDFHVVRTLKEATVGKGRIEGTVKTHTKWGNPFRGKFRVFIDLQLSSPNGTVAVYFNRHLVASTDASPDVLANEVLEWMLIRRHAN